ncbi:putative chalcone/stilbene synthase, polyketide synthase, type III, thiolase [Dioscorea sansibarensis]
MGSINEEGKSKKKFESHGKANILALGKAFPSQLVMQESLVDGYFKNTNCNDPELKQKLARLCKFLSLSYIYIYIYITLFFLFFFLRHLRYKIIISMNIYGYVEIELIIT